MTREKRASTTASKRPDAQLVIQNVKVDLGEPAEELALIAAVHRALDVLRQIRLTPRYGIYIEAQKDE